MRVTKLDPDKIWQEQNYPQRGESSVCVQRYGAFGDMLQMSSFLPELKKKYDHVCVNTTPKGYNVIQNDPHIDEVFLQEDGQVPNKELGPYTERLGKAFTKMVSLTESVEGSLLALEGRKQFCWDADFRRLLMGVDYLEGHHVLAGVPYNPAPMFYPSKKEIVWAKKYRAKLGKKGYAIMWSIAGSSVHKVYPYMDQLLARCLVAYPQVRIILVGDEMGKIGEFGWEKEQRVKRKCGKWSIRESLAMAQQCDMVIGPETGVVNSVSFKEDVHKILFLSHSSPKNLGHNWLNASILTPHDTECYPCHKLHFNFSTCNRDEVTGTALCAANISADRVWEKVVQQIGDV